MSPPERRAGKSTPAEDGSQVAPPCSPLGIIEGFFGRPWSWSARADAIDFMAAAGYHFYLYAPKADAHLRRQWTHDWPEADWKALRQLREQCRDKGIQFGIGLSPLELYRESSSQARAALSAKIRRLNELAPDTLGLLFDDMRGDLPELAERQVELAHTAADASTANRMILCPTYYSTDPLLEKVFGVRPAHYWQDLGHRLDPAIDIFWTGEEVCSRHYPLSHLVQVRDWLQRKPFLWDNYPVNDSARLCNFLRLSAYPASHGQLNGAIAGHAVNPMNQAYLSRLPLATLPLAYGAGRNYRPEQALKQSFEKWSPASLRGQLETDLPLLEECGLAGMNEAEKAALRSRYEPYATTSPLARELLDWLDHGYAFDPACLTD